MDERLRIDESHEHQAAHPKKNHNSSFKLSCTRDQHFTYKQSERLKSLAPALGIYSPNPVTKNVKVLPVFAREPRPSPNADRLSWVDKKKLKESQWLSSQLAHCEKFLKPVYV